MERQWFTQSAARKVCLWEPRAVAALEWGGLQVPSGSRDLLGPLCLSFGCRGDQLAGFV